MNEIRNTLAVVLALTVMLAVAIVVFWPMLAGSG